MPAHSSLILEMLPDGSFRECERMKYGVGFHYLMGILPYGSPDAPLRSLKVKVLDDTPDGTYWPPDAQIVIRTSAGWSLWRYAFTVVSAVLRRRKTGIRNLMLSGVGIGRLAGVPVIRWLEGWAANRGVLLSGFQRSYPCLCRNCIGRDLPSGSPGCRGGTFKRRCGNLRVTGLV